MTHRGSSDVEALLRRVNLWAGPVTVTPLQGGYLNEVVLVETGARRLVLKFFADPIAGTLFPNLPDDEARAAQRLSGLEVAPALIGYWPEEHAMACAYVRGGPWNGDMAAVARLLLRKEDADPSAFRTVPVTPAEILAAGDALFARVGPEPPARPAPADVAAPERLSLIHTDIGASNLIGQGDELRLIDWQCPAMGDLCEDIYSFLSPAFQILSQRAPFTDTQRAEFFAALQRPDVEARFRRLEPFYAWRMAGYCALRAATHPEAAVRDCYRRAFEAERPRIEG